MRNDMNLSDWVASAAIAGYVALGVWALMAMSSCNRESFERCGVACGSIANVERSGNSWCECVSKP